MSSSCSNARASIAAVTVPSMAFSMATKPRSTSPRSVASSTSGIDHHRSLRQGTGEAVYAPGKTAEQCAAIVAELLGSPGGPVLLTRATKEQIDAATATSPGATVTATTATWRHAAPRDAAVLVVT